MVDKKKITDINSAKSHNDYDGGTLDAAQQAVFDQVSIPKNADGTPKIVELQEVAETLEKVIQAKKATAWNKTLYDELNDKKTANHFAYQAINYNNQYDTALTSLKAKESPQSPTPTPGSSEEAIQKEIDTLATGIANFDAEIKKVQAQRDIQVKLKAIKVTETFYLKQAYDKIVELKERLQNQGVTDSTDLLPINGKKGVKPIVNNGINVNQPLRDMIIRGKSPEFTTNLEPVWESNIAKNIPIYMGTSHGRHFLWKQDADELNFQIMNFLKKIDNDKMIAAIDKYVTTSAHNVTAKKLWKEMKESKFMIIPFPTSHQNSHRAGTTMSNFGFYYDGQGIVRELGIEDKEYLKNKEGWHNFLNLFEFMRIVFPRTNHDNIVRDLELGDNERSSIHLRTFSKNPYTEVSPNITSRPNELFLDWFSKNFPNKRSEMTGVEYNGTGQGLNLREHVGFFYDAYPTSANIFSDTIGDTNFNVWESGYTVSEAGNYEEFIFTKWVKGIRDGGYSKDIIDSGTLWDIFVQNKDFTEDYFNKTCHFSEEGKKETIKLWTNGIYGGDDIRVPDELVYKVDFWGEENKIIRLSGNNTTVVNLNDDCSGYLWIPGFDLALAKKRNEISLSESSESGYDGGINILSGNEASLISQRDSLIAEKAEKEKKLAEFKSKGLEDNIAAWKVLYASYANGERLTRQKIWNIRIQYSVIRGQSATRGVAVDADVQTKFEKFDKEVIVPLSYPETMVQDLTLAGKTPGKATEGLTMTTLGELQGYFDAIFKIRDLDDSEKKVYDVIKARRAGTYKDDSPQTPPPTSDLTEASLTTLFGFAVDKDLKDKWAITLDTIALTESNLKTIFLNDYGKTGTKHGALIDHLGKTGDVDGNKQDISDDAKKAIAWENFIKTGPEKVIKTIVAHEFEEIKDNAEERKNWTDEMAAKTDGDEVLDKSKYGGDKFDDAGIKKYMYEKKIGKKHEFIAKESQKNTKKTPSSLSDWFKFRKDNILKPCVTYIGGSLLIIGVGVAIFWKNITDWWNGPAEEEGKADEDKENDEENE